MTIKIEDLTYENLPKNPNNLNQLIILSEEELEEVVGGLVFEDLTITQ